MDFEQTPEGAEAAELAGIILEKHCSAERLKEVEAGPARFDHDLWRRFADSGLISLTVPEEHDGSGFGMLELAQPADRGRTQGCSAPARRARRHLDGPGRVREPDAAGAVAARLAGSASSS